MEMSVIEAPTSPTKTPGIRLGKNNTYVIDCIKCVHGRRLHIYSSGYLSLQEAREAMPNIIAERIEEAEKRSDMEMNFSEFMKRYEDYRLLHVRLSTVQFCRSIRRSYLTSWEKLPLRRAFSSSNINIFYQTLLNSEGTAAWKNRCFGTLRQMIEAAFKWRYIDASIYQDASSILENVPENRGQKKEKEVWSHKERQAFLGAIEDKDDKVLFTLFVTLGARIGEFAGLTWDCFDARRGYIEIKQQLIYGDVGKWVLSPQLKTSESYRLCKLSPSISKMLSEFKSKGTGKGFIFTTDGTNPMSKAAIRRKMYFYAEKAGLKRVTPHALRHGKAMDLMKVCRNMQEVKAAARFLGHSATMMIDTYGHSEKKATEAVLKRLEKEEENLS